MSPIIGYLLVLAIGVGWIAFDAETAYIFDVFGKNFHWAWYQSGKRWTYMLTYGWRLLALCLLIAIEAILAYRALFPAVQPLKLDVWRYVALFATCSVPFLWIPWIHLVVRLRYRRFLRRTAILLTPIVERISATADLSKVMKQAAYKTDPNWSAWHPNRVSEWPQIVPVAYRRSGPSTTVVFPVCWDYFLAWRLGGDFARNDGSLPFEGPSNSVFDLRSMKPLHGVPEWSLIRAELRSDEEAAAESRD